MIIAPRKVRSEQVYAMHVTLYRLHYSALTVRAVLSQDGDEYVSGSVDFYDTGTKPLQLKVGAGPSSWGQTYKLVWFQSL